MVKGRAVILSALIYLLHGGVCAQTYTSHTEFIRVGTRMVHVDTGGEIRVHDFGLSGGFVDQDTNIPRLATLIAAADGNRNIVLSGRAITNEGIAGRARWTSTGVELFTRAGEGKRGEPCRAQGASYPVASDVDVTWSLRVQFGDAVNPWMLLPTGQDPVLVWQLKAPNLRPSLAMIVDTDDTDDTKLMVYFSQLAGAGASDKVRRVGTIRGLTTETPIDIKISAVLDDREISASGLGGWHAFVNGHRVVDQWGPTLAKAAKDPHQWFFGIYRYAMACPNGVSRFTRWEKLLLIHNASLSEENR